MTARRQRLYHRLQLTAHEMRKSADRELAADGLSTAQAAVLAVIRADEPVNQRLVAGQLGLNESAMSAMVRRLMEAGLVERGGHERDGRVRLLTTTGAGRDALARAERSFRPINAAIDRALSPAEVAVLAGLLDRIRAELGAAG